MNTRLLFLLALALPALVALPACGEKEDTGDADGGGTDDGGTDDGGTDDGGTDEGGDDGSEGQTTVCGDATCTPDQYCYTFEYGANPDSGASGTDPACVDAPPECAGIATCACLEAASSVSCGQCSDSDGIYCKEYGA